MPTRRGRMLLAGAAGCYVLARALAVDELYALAVAALAFPLVACVAVRLVGHRLRFARALPTRRVFVGGPIRIELVARNDGHLVSPPLFLEDAAPATLGGPVRLALASLAPTASGSVAAERSAAARGRYAIGPARARLVDPFGLAEVSSQVLERANVVVYPRVEPLHESAPPEERGESGASQVFRLAASGEEFYAVREWQDGDDLRKIHWRSSARRGDLMIRQDEVRPFPRATILVDTRASSHPQSSSLEWAISAAASLVWELARQGFALRLATADVGPGGARWGREATDPLLTTLAVAGRSAHASLQHVLRRVAARPGAGGALLAFVPPGDVALARLRASYAWCGAVLLDVPSFAAGPPRERAAFDQRLAEADRTLERAGWRVATAGASDRFRDVWEKLIGVSRPSSQLRRS